MDALVDSVVDEVVDKVVDAVGVAVVSYGFLAVVVIDSFMFNVPLAVVAVIVNLFAIVDADVVGYLW